MRVPITGLVGHPGETRAVSAAVAPEEFGTDPWGPTIEAVLDPVEVDLHLDAVVEGILVRGTLGFTVVVPCARCLEPQELHRDVSVMELFLDPRRVEDGDEQEPGYELEDDVTSIDLSTMARDALVVDLPIRTLCREDCQGLCPTCGADRNREDCGHDAAPLHDARWAKLADLELPAD